MNYVQRRARLAVLALPFFLLTACTLDNVGAATASLVNSSTPVAENNSVASEFSTTPSTTIATARDGSSVSVTISRGRLLRMEALAPPSGAPSGFTYPQGFYALDITDLPPGASVTVTMTLSTGARPAAYVKCLGNACAVFPGTLINDNQIQFVLRDGGAGDSDGSADGTIHDPGAPAYTKTGTGNPPVDPPANPPANPKCTLAAGERTLLEWDGVVAIDALGLTGSEDRKPFALPADCSIASMTVTITWEALLPLGNIEDLDLSVDAPAGAPAIPPAAAGNTLSEPMESLSVDEPALGDYLAHVTGFISASTPYHGKVTVMVRNTLPQCSDGIDNDGDGKIDFGGENGDPGCSSATDDTELEAPPAPQCADGLDNDEDGKIDFGGENGDPGCSSATDNDETDIVTPTNVSRVVVADIDSGINPYHIFYNPCTNYGAARVCSPIYPEGSPPSSVTPEVLAAFGIDQAHQITLTRTGNFAADFAADQAKWNAIKTSNPERGGAGTGLELYWFTGTNIIAASFDLTGQMILPDDEDDTHGVGTSAAVLTANPEAILLFAESGDQFGESNAEHLGFLHPLVDIVTTSYGYQVPFVGVGIPLPLVTDSFESVITLGKLHFSSAANSPDPFTPESASGPWWTVNIAGIEEGSSEGRTITSGFFTDFVADFTQTLPYCMACENGYDDFVAGTSFATPRSAGVASRVLLEARRRMNHLGGITTVGGKPVLAATASGASISTWQLRRALERAAYVPTLGSYSPVDGVFDISVPVPDAAPWLIVGWGELSATPAKGVVNETLAALGFGASTRTKAAGTCEFQTVLIQRRKFFWDNIGFFFNSYETPAQDPFIGCGSALPSLF